MSDAIELYPNNTKRIEFTVTQPQAGEGTAPVSGLNPTVRLVALPTDTAAIHASLSTTALEYDATGEYYADLQGATIAARLADATLTYGRYYLQIVVGTTLVAVANVGVRRYRRLSVTLPS